MYDNEQALLDDNEQASLEDNQDYNEVGSWDGSEEESQNSEQGSCQDPDCGISRAKSAIAALWQQSADNSFAIGDWLLFLYGELSSQQFSEYMSNDLADLGIGRSTGYRWMVLAANLGNLFPNSLLRQAIMRLAGGRGIFANVRPREVDAAPHDEEVPNPFGTPLTDAAREALDGMVAPPQEEEGDEIAHGWAKSFIQYMNQIRARQRAEKCAALKTPQTQREAILRKLNDFAADFGAEELEILREQMDQFFGPRIAKANAETHAASAAVQPKVNAQSQLEIESEAELEPASAEGESRRQAAQSQVGIGNALTGQPAAVNRGADGKPLRPSSSPSAQSMTAPQTQKGGPAADLSSLQSQLEIDPRLLRQAILEVLGIRTRRDKRSLRQNKEEG
jgi:hypothetical protein